MPRDANLKIIPWTFSLFSAYHKAKTLLRDFKPDVVFGTGGYVTGPVLLAARSLHVPYVIHEPDAYPGLVNRVMARWAGAVTCAFGAARERLKTDRLHVTGNPLRSRIGNVSREDALTILQLPFTLDKSILLVTGGSQGARRINQGILEALPRLVGELNLQIIHQTGDKLFDETMAQCPEEFQNHSAYHPVPFIQDMAATLALADVAVCRSGSMTLSEMYRGHIPTILVPYPYAAADHQRKNALASQEAGASVMIEDNAFTGDQLIWVLTDLFGKPDRLQSMRQAAEKLASPDATAHVAEIIKGVAQKGLY